MNALPKLFERVLRLQVRRRNAFFRLFGIVVDGDLRRLRLHDDGRDRMPRRVVNILCNALPLFERGDLLQLVVGNAKFLVAARKVFGCL